MDNLLSEALRFAKQGFKVFPCIPNQKRPIKDWSYLKATNDPEEVYNVFNSKELYNVGINLKEAKLIVLDLDRHRDGQDGLAWLGEKAKQSLDGDCVVSTPRNGLHVYYSLSGADIPNKLELADGVELLTDFCTLPPSFVDIPKDNINGGYKLVSGSFEAIQPIPSWLLSEVQAKQGKRSITLDFTDTNRPKTYFTARFMAELKQGAGKGSRNSWITRQFGRMVSLGMSYEDSFDWIKIVNQNFIEPPLNDKELNGIVYSIIKRENRKLANSERSERDR